MPATHSFSSILAAVALAHLSLAAQVISHQLLDSTPGALRDNSSGVVGTVFRVSDADNRLVTHLGYYDAANDGLRFNHRVGLYAATPAGAGTGALLAELTIPASTDAFLENGYRWMPLPASLTLETNVSYVLAAEVAAGSGDPHPGASVPVWNRYFVGYHSTTSRAARSSTNAWPQEPEAQGNSNTAFGAANLGLALTPRPYRIMPVGDSITAGYTDNPNWRVPFQFGYRGDLFSLLSQSGIPFQFDGIQAVLSGGPTVILTAPATTREASPGTVLNVNAFTAAGSGGDAVRLQLLVNGVPQFEATGNSLTTAWQVPVKGAHRLSVRAFDAGGKWGERAALVLGTDPSAGPGGVTDGLRVWLKAEAGVVFGSGKSVQRWQDRSGNANDALQPGASLEPKDVEGLFGPGPGLRFDGARFLTSTNGMPTGSYTKVVRCFISHTGAINNLLSSASSGSTSARGHSLLFGLGQQTLKLSHNGNVAVATTNAPLGQPIVAMATYDASSALGEIYLDGVLVGSGTAEGGNTLASYQVGALAGASRLSGAVSEVLIYDRVLTAPQRQALLRYFNDTSLGVTESIDTHLYSVFPASGPNALFLRLRVLLPG